MTILADYEFVPVTPKTITDLQEFQAELERVRKEGYAVDEEENELGGRCLAAAVLDVSGRPVAALSISVPIQRLPRERISKVWHEDQGSCIRNLQKYRLFSNMRTKGGSTDQITKH